MRTAFDEFFGVKKPKTVYVGIDPDREKSGVAKYRCETEKLEVLLNLSFFELFDYLKEQNDHEPELVVVVEAGWLNKGNWHTRASDNHRKAASIGRKVGENHEVGKKIVEMCEYLGINHKLVQPTSMKKDADTFRQITGWVGRTNPEMRDAAMLVYGR